MRRIFIYGVSGDIGHRTAQALVAKGHHVSGLVRSEAKAERLNTYGIETVVGDLTHATLAQHTDWLAGIDVVMFSAGASSEEGDEVKAIDYRAVVVSAAAAKQQNVSAYYLISAFPEAGRQRERSAGFEIYIQHKKMAEAGLVESGAPWTILRPSKLVDTPSNGQVIVGPALNYGQVSRQDFANFVAQTLDQQAFAQQIVEVNQG